MMSTFDVVVIGAGPAGMTAALYLRRSNYNVLLIEKEIPGGLMNKTSIIENYPGIESILGTELSMKMYDQVEKTGIETLTAEVKKIKDGDIKTIITNNEKIKTKGIVIASGRTPKKLDLQNVDRLTGFGVSYCAICDGPLFKKKNVAIVGGGNSALEEGLYLSSLANKVTIINRSDKLRADQILVDKANSKDNINILYNSEITKLIEEDEHLKGVQIIDNKTDEIREIELNGLFTYIGYEPATAIVEELNITDEKGYIVVDDNMRTKIKGITACGDIIKKDLYQIITACGEGALAAISLIKDIK